MCLKKSEASTVMHEILQKSNGDLDLTCISLDYSYGSKLFGEIYKGYRLKIKCVLDRNSREVIQAILDRHNLKIELIGDSLVIY